MTPVPLAGQQKRSRELLSEAVRRRLLTAIVDGTLVVGERLHDEELIAWLGVSRTPIRTALERLAESGLVEMEPNRFTRVAVPTRASLLHALDLYSALHAWIAEEIVPELDVASAADALERFAGVRRRASQSSTWLWSREDLAAVDHAIGFFSDRTGNPLLIDLLFEIRVRLTVSFANVNALGDPAAIAMLADAVSEAVTARDGLAAGRALREGLSSRIVLAGPRHVGGLD